MTENCVGRLTRVRIRTVLLAATTLLAWLASLDVVSPALARSPTGDFAVFSQCPRFTAGVNLCLYARPTNGEMTLNKQTVPIVNTMTLQGGIELNTRTFAETFVGALNGETLSKTPQPVPGGLSGLVKCKEINSFSERNTCEGVFENGATSLIATIDLARPADEIAIDTDNLSNGEGIGLSLPVRIHLINPFLGSACYIGSSSKPVTLNLTTGTTSPPAPNRPISGSVGRIRLKDEFELAEITSDIAVDNSFSAPEATGCGGIYWFLIDRLIDRKIGLPSAAGRNTAIINSTIEEGTTEAVIASER
jgi:hypothetical protein